MGNAGQAYVAGVPLFAVPAPETASEKRAPGGAWSAVGGGQSESPRPVLAISAQRHDGPLALACRWTSGGAQTEESRTA